MKFEGDAIQFIITWIKIFIIVVIISTYFLTLGARLCILLCC